MAFQLLDAIKDYISPNLLNDAAAHLGESSSGITKAASAAIPALVAGMISKSESGGAAELLNESKNMSGTGMLDQREGLFGGNADPELLNRAGTWLNSVFGSKLGNIVSSIARFSGIRNISANALLGMLTPVGLGALGKFAGGTNLSPSGLSDFLSGQKTAVMNAMPSGLGLSSLFGPQGLEKSVPKVVAPPTIEHRSRSYVMPALFLVGGLVLLTMFLTRSCHNEQAVTGFEHTRPAPEDKATTVNTVEAPPGVNVKLQDGNELAALKGGIEDRLVACLNNPACKAGKDQWFDFDNINFELGSAKLTEQSNTQIKNIVAVLKAYPAVKIKIGGYTDKTGDPSSNIKLSQERADAVLNALKLSGAKAIQLVGAEGYGSAFARVDASAPDEERRKDRRIALQVREK